MNIEPDRIISFAEFELDTVRRRLTCGDETIAMHAKAFDLLAFLASNNGRVVSKNEILDAVWNEQFVEESNLVVQISNLRKALGETKNAPRFLITVPGKGYKFAADTNENLLTVETRTVSELTIEHEEEIDFGEKALPEKDAFGQKWLSVAAILAAAVLTVGAIGYLQFRKNIERDNFAFGWTDASRRASPKQLTANGKINVAAISPDGKYFAAFYRPSKDEKLKLAVFSVGGGELIYSFDIPVDLLYEKLRWTPDGDALVYAFYNSTAWRQKLSGGEPEKFLEFPGENINAFAWSCDGKTFAVAYGQEVRDAVLFTIER